MKSITYKNMCSQQRFILILDLETVCYLHKNSACILCGMTSFIYREACQHLMMFLRIIKINNCVFST